MKTFRRIHPFFIRNVRPADNPYRHGIEHVKLRIENAETHMSIGWPDAISMRSPVNAQEKRRDDRRFPCGAFVRRTRVRSPSFKPLYPRPPPYLRTACPLPARSAGG